MPPPEPTESLNRLSTHWSLLLEARGGGAAAREAQCAVLQRYGAAIYHYLAATTSDPHAAADLAQEFALKFVRGDFQEIAPDRGQFRKLLRTVLYRMAMDHFRAKRRAPAAMPADAVSTDDADAEFDRRWRTELLERTWDELRQAQAASGSPYYEALRWRAENPDRPAADGAEALVVRLGRAFTADAYRQTLHRARERFAQLLREEIRFSIGREEPAAVDDELAELGLLQYCRT